MVSTALHRLPMVFGANPVCDDCVNACYCHYRFMQLDLKTHCAGD